MRNSYSKTDLTGQKFGMLTPMEWLRGGQWRCLCDCGNETVVSTRNLMTGHTTSCGCKRYASKNVTDMLGYEDENIKVLSRADNIGDIAAWECLCKHCGRTFVTKGSNIRFGYTKSCGCVRSSNEREITSLLLENGVDFIAQYTFPDLIGVGGRPLRFDFAIFENGKLKRLIEFHGEQHFGCPGGRWSIGYGNLVENDIRKRQYCKRNGIDLKMIPFDKPYDIHDILD